MLTIGLCAECHFMDEIDRRILHWLQQDATMPVAELADRAGISPTPCWRRVQRLVKDGIILRRVALLDAKRINVGVNVFVSIRTNQHKKAWADQFCRAVMALPEVVGFYRMAGQIDYLMHIVVPGIDAYDDVYTRLISEIELYDVSASFAIETLKSTTALPLHYIGQAFDGPARQPPAPAGRGSG